MSVAGAMVALGRDKLDHNPAAVYLAGLESETARRTMRNALGTIADLLSPGRWDKPEEAKCAARPVHQANNGR
jgi:hypothetical protein